MKVIFLDVDGVLNGFEWLARVQRENHTTDDKDAKRRDIDPAAVARLLQIVESTGAKVVLSSSWRLYFGSASDSKEFFANLGVDIYDQTPVSGTRGAEILLWRMAHPGVTNFVVLDDDVGDMIPLPPNFIRTMFFGKNYGLRDEHVAAAINLLGRK